MFLCHIRSACAHARGSEHMVQESTGDECAWQANHHRPTFETLCITGAGCLLADPAIWSLAPCKVSVSLVENALTKWRLAAAETKPRQESADAVLNWTYPWRSLDMARTASPLVAPLATGGSGSNPWISRRCCPARRVEQHLHLYCMASCVGDTWKAWPSMMLQLGRQRLRLWH